MPSWSFHNPTRVIFGERVFESIGEIVDAENTVIVTSPGFSRRGIVNRLEELLNGRVLSVLDTVNPNPSLGSIVTMSRLPNPESIDGIVALGGGSSLDTAKALSRILSSKGDGRNPAENSFWDGSTVDEDQVIPVFAIPTTAGTGSEVTPTATIWDYESKKKLSLCGDDLFPKVAIVDPVLTHDLPNDMTISSGLDAISHALESIWNRNAGGVSTTLATESLRMSLKAMPRLKMNGQDHQARNSMMQASMMAGLAISQTRTALSHSVSYPITMDLGVPHGVACSFALPEVLEFNAPSDDGRLEILATHLGYETISALADGLRQLLKTTLADTGLMAEMMHVPRVLDLEERMLTKGRADNNIRPADTDDLSGILRNALGRYTTQ